MQDDRAAVNEPGLLSLQGQVANDTLEAAVEAVRSGLFPGWRVAYDRIKVEMVTGQPQQPGWQSLSGATQAFTQSMARSPAPVWVLVVENEAVGRDDVVKFLLAGGERADPLWVRIRPDASVPIAGRKMRLRPRRDRRRIRSDC